MGDMADVVNEITRWAERAEKAEAEVERLCGLVARFALNPENTADRVRALLAKPETSGQDDQTVDALVAKRQAPIATKPMGDAAEVERLRGLLDEIIPFVRHVTNTWANRHAPFVQEARTLLAKLEAEDPAP